jgi:hypothetical protein
VGFASLAVGNVGLKAYELKLELDSTTKVKELPSSAKIAAELLAMIPVEVLMALVAHIAGKIGGKLGAKAKELYGKWEERKAKHPSSSETTLSQSEKAFWDQFGRDGEKIESRPAAEFTTAERRAAFFRVAWVRLKLLIGRGETTFLKNISEARSVMADLTVVIQREIALLRLPDGRTVLRVGKRSSVRTDGAIEVLAHSHTSGDLMISTSVVKGEIADTKVLRRLGQTDSFIVGADGKLVKFTSESAQWLDDIEYTILHEGTRL